MIALTSTNFLEALMVGAPATTNPTFYTSYAVTDSLQDFKEITPASGSLSGATPVTLVAAPGGSDLRHDVRDLTIFNVDTQANTITLRVDVSAGTKLNIWTGVVDIGGFVRLENNTGRIVIYNSTGAETSSISVPSLHAATHQHGGSDEVATATPAANAIPKALGTGKLDAAWLPAGAAGNAVFSSGHDNRVPGSGTQYLFVPGGTNFLEAGHKLGTAITLVRISVTVDVADGSNDYNIEVVSDPTGSPSVLATLALGSGVRFNADTFAVAVGSTIEWGVRLVRSSGAGSSTFRKILVDVEVTVP